MTRGLRRIVPVSCVALTWLAASCAVKQPPPPADQIGETLPAASVPPQWRTATHLGGPVMTEWVQTFGDAQLEAIIEEGLRNNLDLRAAAARVDLALALSVQARSQLYPQISASSSLGVVGSEEISDRIGLAGSMSWELDLWGRVRAQSASADASRQAADADLQSARQSLAAMVATLWYQTVATERLRQTTEEAAVVYTDLLRLVRVRNVIGQVGQQDVALAGADLDRARQRERAFAASGQSIERSLEVLIGRYPAAEVALAPDLPTLPDPVPDGLPSELLERRPDLVAASRRVAAAFHAIQAAEAARLPRIALTAGGGRSSSELLRLAGVPANFWQTGLDLLAPIFTGGALQAAVRAADANQRAALALYGQAALRAFSEVENSLTRERNLSDQQRYLESVLVQDTDALRLGRLRYDVGADDLLHVLNLQARQLNTQFELIGVRNDRLATRIALHLALGGGFTPNPNP